MTSVKETFKIMVLFVITQLSNQCSISYVDGTSSMVADITWNSTDNCTACILGFSNYTAANTTNTTNTAFPAARYLNSTCVYSSSTTNYTRRLTNTCGAAGSSGTWRVFTHFVYDPTWETITGTDHCACQSTCSLKTGLNPIDQDMDWSVAIYYKIGGEYLFMTVNNGCVPMCLYGNLALPGKNNTLAVHAINYRARNNTSPFGNIFRNCNNELDFYRLRLTIGEEDPNFRSPIDFFWSEKYIAKYNQFAVAMGYANMTDAVWKTKNCTADPVRPNILPKCVGLNPAGQKKCYYIDRIQFGSHNGMRYGSPQVAYTGLTSPDIVPGDVSFHSFYWMNEYQRCLIESNQVYFPGYLWSDHAYFNSTQDLLIIPNVTEQACECYTSKNYNHTTEAVNQTGTAAQRKFDRTNWFVAYYDLGPITNVYYSKMGLIATPQYVMNLAANRIMRFNCSTNCTLMRDTVDVIGDLVVPFVKVVNSFECLALDTGAPKRYIYWNNPGLVYTMRNNLRYKLTANSTSNTSICMATYYLKNNMTYKSEYVALSGDIGAAATVSMFTVPGLPKPPSTVNDTIGIYAGRCDWNTNVDSITSCALCVPCGKYRVFSGAINNCTLSLTQSNYTSNAMSYGRCLDGENLTIVAQGFCNATFADCSINTCNAYALNKTCSNATLICSTDGTKTYLDTVATYCNSTGYGSRTLLNTTSNSDCCLPSVCSILGNPSSCTVSTSICVKSLTGYGQMTINQFCALKTAPLDYSNTTFDSANFSSYNYNATNYTPVQCCIAQACIGQDYATCSASLVCGTISNTKRFYSQNEICSAQLAGNTFTQGTGCTGATCSDSGYKASHASECCISSSCPSATDGNCSSQTICVTVNGITSQKTVQAYCDASGNGSSGVIEVSTVCTSCSNDIYRSNHKIDCCIQDECPNGSSSTCSSSAICVSYANDYTTMAVSDYCSTLINNPGAISKSNLCSSCISSSYRAANAKSCCISDYCNLSSGCAQKLVCATVGSDTNFYDLDSFCVQKLANTPATIIDDKLCNTCSNPHYRVSHKAACCVEDECVNQDPQVCPTSSICVSYNLDDTNMLLSDYCSIYTTNPSTINKSINCGTCKSKSYRAANKLPCCINDYCPSGIGCDTQIVCASNSTDTNFYDYTQFCNAIISGNSLNIVTDSNCNTCNNVHYKANNTAACCVQTECANKDINTCPLSLICVNHNGVDETISINSYCSISTSAPTSIAKSNVCNSCASNSYRASNKQACCILDYCTTTGDCNSQRVCVTNNADTNFYSLASFCNLKTSNTAVTIVADSLCNTCQNSHYYANYTQQCCIESTCPNPTAGNCVNQKVCISTSNGPVEETINTFCANKISSGAVDTRLTNGECQTCQAAAYYSQHVLNCCLAAECPGLTQDACENIQVCAQVNNDHQYVSAYYYCAEKADALDPSTVIRSTQCTTCDSAAYRAENLHKCCVDANCPSLSAGNCGSQNACVGTSAASSTDPSPSNRSIDDYCYDKLSGFDVAIRNSADCAAICSNSFYRKDHALECCIHDYCPDPSTLATCSVASNAACWNRNGSLQRGTFTDLCNALVDITGAYSIIPLTVCPVQV